jgi:hypothetical protein
MPQEYTIPALVDAIVGYYAEAPTASGDVEHPAGGRGA